MEIVYEIALPAFTARYCRKIGRRKPNLEAGTIYDQRNECRQCTQRKLKASKAFFMTLCRGRAQRKLKLHLNCRNSSNKSPVAVASRLFPFTPDKSALLIAFGFITFFCLATRGASERICEKENLIAKPVRRNGVH
jgi:hypothetical protein